MKGRVIFLEPDKIWLSVGEKIFVSYDHGISRVLVIKLPVSAIEKLLMRFSLLSRLFRKGIHHLQMSDDHKAVCIANSHVFWIDLVEGEILAVDRLVGNRPLNICGVDNTVLYGEYVTRQRDSIRLMKSSTEALSWEVALSLPDVRHIHGIYHDVFDNNFWLTTGDSNSESKIMILSSCYKISKILFSGSQQARIVQPLFLSDCIYFATDAPDELNYIYRFDRQTQKLERETQVGGPVYFGTSDSEISLFATVVEPSAINQSGFVEIWMNYRARGWKKVMLFAKDCLPFKFFQYGQVMFPNSFKTQAYDYFYIYEYGTKSHGKTHRLSRVQIIELYESFDD